MGRAPCCPKDDRNKGVWTKEEDDRLVQHIQAHGEGCWRSLPKAAGLRRCSKSCRLRWINYLRPDLKRGIFSEDEDDLILRLHALLGNKWSLISGRLPGRTDIDIRNYWNSHLKRKVMSMGLQKNSRRHHISLPGNVTETEIECSRENVQDFFRCPSELSAESEQVSCAASVLVQQLDEHPELNLELTITCPSIHAAGKD